MQLNENTNIKNKFVWFKFLKKILKKSKNAIIISYIKDPNNLSKLKEDENLFLNVFLKSKINLVDK